MLISTTTIENVKQAANLKELVQEHGVKLKRTGSSFTGLCPFHDERTPSFSLYGHGHRHYKCFGCGKSGTAIAFFMATHPTLTYPEAIRALADKYGIEVIEEKP